MSKVKTPETIVSAERLREVLDYDATSGVFTWKKMLSKNVHPGRIAGGVQANGYRYIRIDKLDYLAQRLAWLHVYGEWPKRILQCKPGADKGNPAIADWYMGTFPTTLEERRVYDKQTRKNRPDVFRNYALKATFGIDLEQYQAMFLAQNGVCAICAQPERVKRDGRLKWLAVDHCHQTNAIRGLLCSSCNTAIGHLGDSVERISAAVAYLERAASERPDNVVPLRAGRQA